MKKIIKNITLIVAGFFLLNSCEDNIDTVNGPIPYSTQLIGYSNSDEIASSNLISKLSFENNISDSKNGLTSGNGKHVNYSSGIKGQSWNGSSDEQRYAIFNAASSIGTLNAMTFAFWMNSSGTVANTSASPVQGKGGQGIFSLVNPNNFWGGINIFLENPDASNPDLIRLKFYIINNRSGVSWTGQSPMINISGQKDKWMHIAMTYDPSTSIFSAYVNGSLAANVSGPYSPANGYPGMITLYANDPGSANNSNNAPKYGNIEYGASLNTVVFGSHQFQTTPALNVGGNAQPWATDFAGKIDEFRIYNAVLTAGQINALYTLEKVGN